MIKKSLFEKELEAGMQRELHKQASSETPDLVKAAECIHAAIEIFEEAGLTAKADALLAVLEKIAVKGKDSHVQLQMPSIQKLMEAGLTQKDLHAFSKGDLIAKAKFNLVLHQLGYSDHSIAQFIGKHNVMSKENATEMLNPNRNFGKIWEWMQDPTKPVDPGNPQPGETLSIQPLEKKTLQPGQMIEMKSIAKPRKPKSPLSIKDPRTKGLTSEKMIANLKNHGTEFNMADNMNADFDEDISNALGLDRADELEVDVPQGPEFEDDWMKWRRMTSPTEEAPATLPAIPVKMKTLRLEDLDDASDFVISDDILEVDEKDLPQDFEDERD